MAARFDRQTRDLLAEFRDTGQEACFEEIVRRYGEMVLNVCLRVTRQRQDAEDATQVVFLVLAERLRAGETIHSLGAWLQQVASRSSLDIRRSRSRRRNRETVRASEQPQTSPPPSDDHDLAHLIREELDRIPAKYRIPLVLHYFGGLEYAETATELGIKPATLGVRLFRGRKLLAERLSRRGIALSAVALSAALAGLVRKGLSDSICRSVARAAASKGTLGPMTACSSSVTGNWIGVLLASSKIKLAIAAALVTIAAAVGASAAVRRLQELPRLLDLRQYMPSVPSLKSNLPGLRADAGSETPAKLPGDSVRKPENVFATAGESHASPQPGGPLMAPSAGMPGGGRFASNSTLEMAERGRPSGFSSVPAESWPRSTSIADARFSAAPGGPSSTAGGGVSSQGRRTARQDANLPPHGGGMATALGSAAPVHATPAGGAGQFSPGGAVATTGVGPAGGYTAAVFDYSGAVFAATAGNSNAVSLMGGAFYSSPSVLGAPSPTLVDSAYLWSPDPAHASLGTVGAARLVLHGIASNSTPPRLSLIEGGDPSVPTLPQGYSFIGLWGLQSDQPFTSADLTVHYDPAMLAQFGATDSQVTLWGYDGQWRMLNGSPIATDAAGNLISGTGGQIQFFGVAVPEPAGAAVLLLLAGGLLIRRPRPRTNA